jgi:hypothetical protein
VSILNIDKYKVIRADTASELEVEIKKLFDKGYKPQGGICISTNINHGEIWAQAVVKDDTQKKAIPDKYIPKSKL